MTEHHPSPKTKRATLAAMTVVASLVGVAFAQAEIPDINWTRISTEYGDFPAAPGGDQQTASLTGDFDGDGDMDFIITDRTVSPSVYLYQRSSDGWDRSVIEPEELNIEAGGAVADVDRDGDLDIVFGRDWSGGEIWWWENPLPSRTIASTWTRRLVKDDDGDSQQHDQAFGDFDGDGELEFASWVNQREMGGKSSRVEIYEIPANPKASEWTRVDSIGMSGEGLFTADVDGDGVEDLLAGTSWIRYHGPGDYRRSAIEPSYPNVSSRIVGGQFVPGGRAEVLINSGDADGPLYFYQYSGSSWNRTTLIPEVIHGHSLQIGDIDLDGNLDFFTAEMGDPGAAENCRAWIGWGDGAGNFELEIISVGIANHESKLVDLDADGDLDVLSKPFRFNAPRIDAFINDTLVPGLSLDEWDRHSIDPDMPYQPLDVEAADIDGDGKLDIVSGGAWYKNPGSITGNWARRSIGGQLHNMAYLYDFDGDGDIDIFGTDGKHRGGNMGWAENNGSGSFTYHSNIDFGFEGFIQGAIGGVFTEGGPFQVIIQWQSGESNGSGVQAFTVPNDPVNEQWTKTIISTHSAGEQLSPSDLDNDGDIDLFQGRSWLRNEGNNNWSYFEVADFPAWYGIPDRNRLIDIDRDGDDDAVVGLSDFGDGESPPLIWLEHPGDPTQQWPIHIVSNEPWGGYSMDAMDIDFDGDFDILVGEHKAGTRTLIYENNGNGSTWTQHVVDPGGSGIDHHVGTKLYDMDDDGDLDIISIGWVNDKLWLFENRSAVGPDTEPPSMPEDLEAKSVVGPTIHLSWSPSTDNKGVEVYHLFRDGVLIATLEGTSYMDSDVVEGQSYEYYVTAEDARENESDPSATIMPATLSEPAPWWDTNWQYRALLTVDSALYQRFDSIVDVSVNFTQVLNAQSKSGAVDPATVRVVEIDEVGTILDTEVPSQFDAASDFNASSAAKGNLIFSLVGETAMETTRYFYIYFATPSSGATPLAIAPEVAVLDGIEDEGQSSFQITNLTGEFFYHKSGAGFSSWEDLDGNDWINYHPTGDAEGNYRGIPNLVYPGNGFHPGHTNGTSVLESSGPLKATVRSTAENGAWEATWEFYGRFARLTVLKAAADYWFVYEGTPGGTFDAASDFVIRSNGSRNMVNQTWEGDLAGDEWAYVADPVLTRSLFVAQHEADQAIDSYRSFPNDAPKMTVLGFGRNSQTGRFLSGTPKTFTMGLMEEIDYEQAKPYVESAYKPVGVYLRGVGQIQSADEDVEDPEQPEEVDGSNVLSNSGFESNLTNWNFYSSGSDTATTNSDSFAGSKAVQISIGSGGNNIQLFQKNVSLEPNAKYRLSFAAYSNTGRDFHVTLSRHTTPNTNYGLKKERVTVGTEWKTFNFDFTTEGFSNPVSNGRLYFWFADLEVPGDVFHIDQVELKRISSSSSDAIPPSTPANLAAALDSDEYASLTWDESTDNVSVSVYRILRDGTFIAESSSASYTDSSVTPGETYSYQVVAIDTSGNVSGLSDAASLEIPASSGGGGGSGGGEGPSENILMNGGFESGKEDWTFYSNGTGTASTGDYAYSGASGLRVKIGNGGSNIQLYQHDLILDPDATYRLSFAAYSTSGKDLTVSLAKHVPSYNNYGLNKERFDLSNGWKNFTFEFTTSGFSNTVSNGRLYFWFANHAGAGDIYYLDAISLVKVGSGSSDTEAPSTPGNLVANLNLADEVVLDWDASTDDTGVSYYRVMRDGSAYVDVGTNTFLDSSVGPGQTYVYSVFAVDAAGNASGVSNAVEVTIPGNAAPVESSVANGGFEDGLDAWSFFTSGSGGAEATSPGYAGANAVEISVNSKANNIQLYQRGISLEANTRYRLSFAAYSTTGHDLEVSLSKHSSPYTNYGLNQVEVDLETGWRNFTIDFTTTGFGGMVNNGRLFFWFADHAQAGDRYYIDQIVLLPVDSVADDNEAPSVPANLSSVLMTNTEVKLDWDPSDDNVGVLGYITYRDGVDIGNTASTTFEDSGLTPGKSYVYAVTAFDAAGNESGVSSSVTVESPNDGQAPVVPQGIQVATLNESTAIITWLPSFDADGVDHYSVMVDGTKVGEVAATSYLATGLTANTVYQVTVSATDNLGNASAASGSVQMDTGSAGSGSANAVDNGDFESGLSSWNFFTNGAGSASASNPGYQGTGSAAKISLASKASNIQLYQSNIGTVPGAEYVLVFAAKSNTGNDLKVSFSKHSSPYTDFGINRERFDLTDQWQIFTYEFTSKSTGGNNGRLYFWLADNAWAGDVYEIDSVFLFKK